VQRLAWRAFPGVVLLKGHDGRLGGVDFTGGHGRRVACHVGHEAREQAGAVSASVVRVRPGFVLHAFGVCI
jgi:hypothetical protein